MKFVRAVCDSDRAICPTCGTRLFGWDCLTNGEKVWCCDYYCADDYGHNMGDEENEINDA